MYPDQILGLLEIKDPSPIDNKIPDNYTAQQYIEDIYNVRSEIQRVLDRIENEIGNGKIVIKFLLLFLIMQQKNIATILPPMTEVFSGVLK